MRVVIDDFGTGYFSLSHLRQFPVDALKIASEFVQVAEGDSRSAALAGAIVALGESLDIATVAEGIESARAGPAHEGRWAAPTDRATSSRSRSPRRRSRPASRA